MTEPSTHEDTSRGSKSGFTERLTEKRRKHCEYLGDEVVARIVEEYWNEVLVVSNNPPNVSSPTEKCLHILKTFLTAAKDKEGVPLSARRKGIDCAKKILKLIDDAVARKKRAGRSTRSSDSIPGKSSQNRGSLEQGGATDQSVEQASSVRGPLHVDATPSDNGSRNEHHAQAAAGFSCSSTTRKSPNHASGSETLHASAHSDETQRIASLSKPSSKALPESKKAAPANNDLAGRWQPASRNTEASAKTATDSSRTLAMNSNGGEETNGTILTGGPAATKPASNPFRWSAPKFGTQRPDRANEGKKNGAVGDGSTATTKPVSAKPSRWDESATQRLPSTGAPTTSTLLPGRTSRSVSQENTQDLPEKDALLLKKPSQGRSQEDKTSMPVSNATAPGQAPPYQRNSPHVTSGLPDKDASLQKKPSQGRSQEKRISMPVSNATAPGEAPPYQRNSPHVTSELSVSASHSSNATALMGGRFVPATSPNVSQHVLGRSAKALLGRSPQQENSNNSTAPLAQGRSAKVLQGNSTERSDRTSTMAQSALTRSSSDSQDRSSGIQAPRSPNAAQRFIAQQGPKKQSKVVLKVPADVYRPGTNLLYSFSVKERNDKLKLTFQASPVTEYTALNIHDRLTKWDPYWKTLAYISLGTTSTVSDCQPQHDAGSTAARIDVNPLTNISLDGKTTVSLGSLEGLKWGKGHDTDGSLKTGDMALVLRMLPLAPNAKKRADCHLWPKGTFLQIQTFPREFFQRKQQIHDEKEWKGMSKPIDLCKYMKSFHQAFTVQMCCYDKELFYFSVSVCEYRSPEKLFEILTGDGPESLPRLSRENGFEIAVGFAQQETFVIDGDHDEEEDVGKFVFSLFCPFSKILMTTPVRSTKCKHWQCFDLKMFLKMNSRVTGSRWRCATCEQFVALDDLQICGLTSSLLDEFKDVATGSRDRVQFCSDRSYTLLAEQRKRYNKRPSQQDVEMSDVSLKRRKTEQEIIDLL